MAEPLRAQRVNEALQVLNPKPQSSKAHAISPAFTQKICRMAMLWGFTGCPCNLSAPARARLAVVAVAGSEPGQRSHAVCLSLSKKSQSEQCSQAASSRLPDCILALRVIAVKIIVGQHSVGKVFFSVGKRLEHRCKYCCASNG